MRMCERPMSGAICPAAALLPDLAVGDLGRALLSHVSDSLFRCVFYP